MSQLQPRLPNPRSSGAQAAPLAPEVQDTKQLAPQAISPAESLLVHLEKVQFMHKVDDSGPSAKDRKALKSRLNLAAVNNTMVQCYVNH